MATQAELAGHLDMTRQAVAELVQRGVLPNADKGELDLDACRVAYIRHIREQAAGRSENETAKWRAEIAKQKAIQITRENEIAARSVIPQADVIHAWQVVLGHVRAKVLSVPTKAAPILAALGGKPQAIKERLTEIIHECLEDAAAADPFAGADSVRGGDRGGADGAADPEAAAEADGERVGGSEEDPQS